MEEVGDWKAWDVTAMTIGGDDAKGNGPFLSLGVEKQLRKDMGTFKTRGLRSICQRRRY